MLFEFFSAIDCVKYQNKLSENKMECLNQPKDNLLLQNNKNDIIKLLKCCFENTNLSFSHF